MNSVKIEREISVVASYDTVVCGAGPAGWIAAVSSARAGKMTALIDKYGFGISTHGACGRTYTFILFHNKNLVKNSTLYPCPKAVLRKRKALLPVKV